MPAIGLVKILILAVDFDDAPVSSLVINDLPRRMQLGTIESFYKSVSGDQFKPIFNIYPTVARLPKNSDRYGDFEAADPLVNGEYASHLITHDALDQIKSKLDLSQYSAVITVVTGGHSLSGRLAVALSTDHDGFDKVPGDIHNEIVIGNDALDVEDVVPWRLIAHEINHLLGLPDLYLYSLDGQWQGKSPGPFGQQGFLRGDSASDSLAYNRWLRGWIPEERVLCVNNAISLKSISLAPQGSKDGKYELVLMKVSDTKLIAFESPKNKGFMSQTFPNSILIYSVDTTIPIGQGPIRIIPKVNSITSSRLTPSLPDWERYETAALLRGDWVKNNGQVFVNRPLKTTLNYVNLAILAGADDKLKTITCIKGKLVKKIKGYLPVCPTGYKLKI